MGAMEGGSEAKAQSRIPASGCVTRLRPPGSCIPTPKTAGKREGTRIPGPTGAKPTGIPSPATRNSDSITQEAFKAGREHFMRVEVKAMGDSESGVPRAASNMRSAPSSRLKQPSKLPSPFASCKSGARRPQEKQQCPDEHKTEPTVEEDGGDTVSGHKQPAVWDGGEQQAQNKRARVPDTGSSNEVPMTPQDRAFLCSLDGETVEQQEAALAPDADAAAASEAGDSILHSADEHGVGASGWLMGASESVSPLEVDMPAEVELDQSASSDMLTPVFAQAARAESWLTDESNGNTTEPGATRETMAESLCVVDASQNNSEGSFLWHEAEAAAQSVALLERKDSFAAIEAMVAAEVEATEDSSLEVSQYSVAEADLSSVQCAVSPIKSASMSSPAAESYPARPSPSPESSSQEEEEQDTPVEEEQAIEAIQSFNIFDNALHHSAQVEEVHLEVEAEVEIERESADTADEVEAERVAETMVAVDGDMDQHGGGGFEKEAEDIVKSDRTQEAVSALEEGVGIEETLVKEGGCLEGSKENVGVFESLESKEENEDGMEAEVTTVECVKAAVEIAEVKPEIVEEVAVAGQPLVEVPMEAVIEEAQLETAVDQDVGAGEGIQVVDSPGAEEREESYESHDQVDNKMDLSALTSGGGEVELELSVETDNEAVSCDAEVTVDEAMVPLETSVDSTAAEFWQAGQRGPAEIKFDSEPDMSEAHVTAPTDAPLVSSTVDDSSLNGIDVSMCSEQPEVLAEQDSSNCSSMSFADLSTTSLASKQGFISPTEGRIQVSYPVEDWDFSDDCLTPPSATVRNSTFGNPMFVDHGGQQANLTPGSPGRDPDVPATEDSMPATNPLFDEGSSFERSFDKGGLRLWSTPGGGEPNGADEEMVKLNLTADIEAVVEEAVVEAEIVGGPSSSFLGQAPKVEISKSPAAVKPEASQHIEGWEPDELSSVLALCIRHHLAPDWHALLADEQGDELLAKVSKKHHNEEDLQSAANYLLGKRHSKAPPPPPRRPEELNARNMVEAEQSTVDASLLSFKERMAKFRAQEAGGKSAAPKGAPRSAPVIQRDGVGGSPEPCSPPALSAAAASEQPASHAISSPIFEQATPSVLSPPRAKSPPQDVVTLSPSKIPRWSPKKETSPVMSASSTPSPPVVSCGDRNTAVTVEKPPSSTVEVHEQYASDWNGAATTTVHSLARQVEARAESSPQAFPIPVAVPLIPSPAVHWGGSPDRSEATAEESAEVDGDEVRGTCTAGSTDEVALPPAQAFLEQYFSGDAPVDEDGHHHHHQPAAASEGNNCGELKAEPAHEAAKAGESEDKGGFVSEAVKEVPPEVSSGSEIEATDAQPPPSSSNGATDDGVGVAAKPSGSFLMSYFGTSKRTSEKKTKSKQDETKSVVDTVDAEREAGKPVDAAVDEVADGGNTEHPATTTTTDAAEEDPEKFLLSYFGQPDTIMDAVVSVVDEKEVEGGCVAADVIENEKAAGEGLLLSPTLGSSPPPKSADPEAFLTSYFGKLEKNDTSAVVVSNIDEAADTPMTEAGDESGPTLPAKGDAEAFLVSYFEQSNDISAAHQEERRPLAEPIEGGPNKADSSVESEHNVEFPTPLQVPPQQAADVDENSSSSSDSDVELFTARRPRSATGNNANPWGDMNLDLSAEVKDPAVLMHAVNSSQDGFNTTPPVAVEEMSSILSSSIEEGAIYSQDSGKAVNISFEVGSDTTAGDMFFDCTENSNTWSVDSQLSPRFSNPLASHPVAVSPSSASSYYDCDEVSRSSSNVSTPHRLRHTTPPSVAAPEQQQGGDGATWTHELAIEVVTSAATLLAYVGHLVAVALRPTDPIPQSLEASVVEEEQTEARGPPRRGLTEYANTVDVHVGMEYVREVSPEEEEDMVRELLGGVSVEESSVSELDDSRVSVVSGAARPREFSRITEEDEQPSTTDGDAPLAVVSATTDTVSPVKNITVEASPRQSSPVHSDLAGAFEAVPQIPTKAEATEVAVEVAGVAVEVAAVEDAKAETAAMRKAKSPFCGAFRCFSFRRSVAKKGRTGGAPVAVGMNGQALPKVEYEEVTLQTVPEESENELTVSSDIPAAEEGKLETPPDGTGVAAFLAAVSPQRI